MPKSPDEKYLISGLIPFSWVGDFSRAFQGTRSVNIEISVLPPDANEEYFILNVITETQKVWLILFLPMTIYIYIGVQLEIFQDPQLIYRGISKFSKSHGLYVGRKKW